MRRGRLIKTTIVALILLVGGGALALARMDAGAKGAFKGSAVPPLFPDAQVAVVDAPLKAASARGRREARAWLGAHPLATDTQFAAWAVRAIGEPPGGRAPARQLAQLHSLAAHRDPVGNTAATWLEAHGKKEPWKLFLKQAKPFVSTQQAATAKAALKASLALGSTLQIAAKARYRRPSPYATDPSLHGLNQARFSGQTRLSYPSKHTVEAGAALAILQPLDPHLRSEYDWMVDEVAFSRMYAAGHYLTDLTRGMLLGTLIGEYERHKAGLDG